MINPADPRISAFAALCDEYGLHGLAFQHHEICARRAWLHLHRIDYAHLEERMAIGQISHTHSKARDRSVHGLIGLAPDRIDWSGHIVIEAKGKAGAVKAVSKQTVFYALMLMARTGHAWGAAIEIIEQKRRRLVDINEDVLLTMLIAAQDLSALIEGECPSGIDAPICRTCSYQYLCGRS